jgi:hypothetical protein
MKLMAFASGTKAAGRADEGRHEGQFTWFRAAPETTNFF